MGTKAIIVLIIYWIGSFTILTDDPKMTIVGLSAALIGFMVAIWFGNWAYARIMAAFGAHDEPKDAEEIYWSAVGQSGAGAVLGCYTVTSVHGFTPSLLFPALLAAIAATAANIAISWLTTRT